MDRLLERLPGLTSLQLEQPALVHKEVAGPLFSWPTVHCLLPALRCLAIKGAAMVWDATLRPLLTRVFAVGEDEDVQWDDRPMRFRWPALNESDMELSLTVASTASPAEARNLSLQLRLHFAATSRLTCAT